MIAATDVLVIF